MEGNVNMFFNYLNMFEDYFKNGRILGGRRAASTQITYVILPFHNFNLRGQTKVAYEKNMHTFLTSYILIYNLKTKPNFAFVDL